MKGNYGNSTKL